MADIDLKRKHHLGLAGARAAAEKMAEHLGRKFGLKGDWRGDTLHFDRPGVTGALTITASDLHLTVALGFLLKALRGSIREAVDTELDQLFAEHARAAPKEAKKPATKSPPPKARAPRPRGR